MQTNPENDLRSPTTECDYQKNADRKDKLIDAQDRRVHRRAPPISPTHRDEEQRRDRRNAQDQHNQKTHEDNTMKKMDRAFRSKSIIPQTPKKNVDNLPSQSVDIAVISGVGFHGHMQEKCA